MLCWQFLLQRLKRKSRVRWRWFFAPDRRTYKRRRWLPQLLRLSFLFGFCTLMSKSEEIWKLIFFFFVLCLAWVYLQMRIQRRENIFCVFLTKTLEKRWQINLKVHLKRISVDHFKFPRQYHHPSLITIFSPKREKFHLGVSEILRQKSLFACSRQQEKDFVKSFRLIYFIKNLRIKRM